MPRLDTLRRIVAGLGLTMADLYRAQQTVTHLPDGKAEDGTLPPDTRSSQAGMDRQAALRLAKEPGKAIAHCCLAFMEIQPVVRRTRAMVSNQRIARQVSQEG